MDNELYEEGDLLLHTQSGNVFEVEMTNEEDMCVISDSNIFMIVSRENPEGFIRYEEKSKERKILDDVRMDASPDFIKFSIFSMIFAVNSKDVNKAISSTQAVIKAVFEDGKFEQ